MIINSFQCWSESDSDRFQFRRTFPFLYPALLRLIRVYVHLNQNLLQTGRFQPFLRMPLVQWRTDLVAQNSFKSRSCAGLPLQVYPHSFFALLVSVTIRFPLSEFVLILLLPTFPPLARYPEGLIRVRELWLDRKTFQIVVLQLFSS